MSRALDVNLLVYAANEDDPLNRRAQTVLEEVTAGQDPVYLFWPVIMGFVRIATHPRVLPTPLAPAEARHNAGQLLDRPAVRTGSEGPGFWRAFGDLAGTLRGDDVPDAHLVALMRQHGVATIVTRDRGFRRFDGIRIEDPFA